MPGEKEKEYEKFKQFIWPCREMLRYPDVNVEMGIQIEKEWRIQTSGHAIIASAAQNKTDFTIALSLCRELLLKIRKWISICLQRRYFSNLKS